MSERVGDSALPEAVFLIGHGGHENGAMGYGMGNDGVGIVDEEVDLHRVPERRALLLTLDALRSSVDAMDASSLDRAHQEVRRRLELVAPDQWALPTPCGDWSVVDLVRHMAVGATMACQVLAGEPWTREEVVEAVASAPDLSGEWTWRTAEERAAFAAPGALDRNVKHSVMGDIPARQFLGMRVGDALLHAWDLARAIDAGDELDGQLVAEVWAHMAPMAGFIGKSGFFGTGPTGAIGEDAPLQIRLLDLSGRRP